MRPGDHIKVQKTQRWSPTGEERHALDVGYFHHGIYLGDNEVAHYGCGTRRTPRVEVCVLSEFSAGGSVEIVVYQVSDRPDQVLQQASSRTGEMAWRNCEHFAVWCKTSKQARQAS